MHMDPKPVTITTESEEDYTGRDPQPLVAIGGFPVSDSSVNAILTDPDSESRASLSATFARKGKLDVRDFGAVADAVIVYDGAMTSGSAVLSTAHTFTTGDVGKTVGVAGASTVPGGVLAGTIASVSGGVATLSIAATATVTGARTVFGTPNDDAFQAAVDAATSEITDGNRGATVYAPAGQYVVTEQLTLYDYLALVGDGREQTVFCVVKDGGFWLHNEFGSGITHPNNPWTGGTLAHFKIDATWHYRTAGYQSDTKPMGISNVKRCVVTDTWVENSPATAIPFDYAQDGCIISFNWVTGAGRMNNGAQPGGSGIGIGQVGDSNSEPTLVIGNVVIGAARYGIFTEAQEGDPSTASPGYRIVDNYVRGNKVGIGLCGDRNGIVQANTVEANVDAGISIEEGTFAPGFPSLEIQVANNQVYDTTAGPGIKMDLKYQVDARGIDVVNNMVMRNSSDGIQVQLANIDVYELGIRGNRCRKNGRNGIRLIYPLAAKAGILYQSDIVDNICMDNGSAGVTNEQSGLRLGVKMTRCRIRRNTASDTAGGSGVQTYGISLPGDAILTNARIEDNDLSGNKTGGMATAATLSASAIQRNVGYNPVGPTAVTPGASPWQYTAGPAGEILYLRAGTVSVVSKGGVNVASSTDVAITLAANESCIVTYSVAPNVTADRI